MSALLYLFAIAVALVSALALISIWSPRQPTVKLAAIFLAGLSMPVGYVALAELLSKPKPITLEWYAANASEARVLGTNMIEDVAIYVWLQLPDVPEPRAYTMPWSRETAQQLQDALREADSRQTGVAMRFPFEPSLDDREPRFYPLPQPALPQKPSDGGDPMRVQQPEGTQA